MKRGFTLAELLVVISIIAIAVAVLLPVFSGAKKSAVGTVSVSNMRQLGAALLLYAEDNSGFLPPYTNYEISIAALEGPQANWHVPTTSSMPSDLKKAMKVYVTHPEIWFSNLDPAREQDTYYLGIRHKETSYVFSLFNWRRLASPASAGQRKRVAPPAQVHEVEGLVWEPFGPGDSGFNSPQFEWKGPCRSYYPNGLVHTVHTDLHVVTGNCHERADPSIE
jgi:prepilin-type N-terminal cleavage/methylation domain-containing protein